MTNKQILLVLRVLLYAYYYIKIPKEVAIDENWMNRIWNYDPLKLEIEKEINALQNAKENPNG